MGRARTLGPEWQREAEHEALGTRGAGGARGSCVRAKKASIMLQQRPMTFAECRRVTVIRVLLVAVAVPV
eukprot:1448342-Rhodomonas_salina.1